MKFIIKLTRHIHTKFLLQNLIFEKEKKNIRIKIMAYMINFAQF